MDSEPNTPGRATLRVLCCLRLNDALARNYLRPLARAPAVRQLDVIRHADIHGLSEPNLTCHVVGEGPLPLRFLRMAVLGRRLSRTAPFDFVVSFNPLPYGFVGRVAAGLGTAYHLGMIGADWNGRQQRAFWRRSRRILSGAAKITVTGPTMGEAVRRLEPAANVGVLPHCVDISSYTPGAADVMDHDVIFVGRLIERKRVDLVLSAVDRVRERIGRCRLLIVGDGPMRGVLERVAASLPPGEVTFQGFTHDVVAQLRRAPVLLMASESEGFPFAIVEGMCCGLIPVCTAVGTIPDLIRNGENGFLAPRGDVESLADSVERLLRDDAVRSRMRQTVLAEREMFGYEHATSLWSDWLRELAGPSAGP